ncbi:MAG: type VI secretion system membrane subunit TssM [Azonexus sp.]
MKALIKAITHPLLLAIVGLSAIAALIWFAGPLIAFAQWRPLEPEWVRWTLIAVIVTIFVAKKFWAWFKAKRTNAQMIDGLARATHTAPSPSAADEELTKLNQRFDDAIGVLREVRLGASGKTPGIGDLLSLTGRQYLYQLPWYVFIGAPGSGKTTALINSGLQFPLAERFGTDAISGVGGTRNCDWWFTDEAVLLDTAGRYTMQESDREVDSAAWNGFLQLLKKFRPRRPINGIILTISIAELLQQSLSEREAHAATLRARIKELHDQFSIQFPIYVLVTKCDLLSGFMEYLGDLGKDERTQVWGMTFPPRDENDKRPPLADFETEYVLLEQRLSDRLLDRLQQERDPNRRAAQFSFPQQFSSIKPLLSTFLAQVFSASKYEDTPMVRGVYFTSGTQEGSPIDRIMGTLSRTFGVERKIMPPQQSSGRSYFLTRLLREVVFTEQNLAGSNLRWERRRTFLRWGAYAIACTVTIIATTAWFISYSHNRTYIEEVEAKTSAVKALVEALPVATSTDAVSLLPVLKSIREQTQPSLATPDNVPWSMGFGLFQGIKLASASNAAYQRILHDAFLPRLTYRIEEQLRATGRDNLELAYEALKAYIMLFDSEHLDRDALKAWILADWERQLPRSVTVEQRAELLAHLDALVGSNSLSSPVPQDTSLVHRVREMLAEYPLEQRVYSRLKRQGVGADIPEFKLSQAAGPGGPLVFERASGESLTKGIPGLFTYDGYHKVFIKEADHVTQQLAEEQNWVLGISDNASPRRLNDSGALMKLSVQVRRLYLQEYAKIWESFLADVKLIRSTSLQQSIQLARIMSAPDSPLPLFLRAVAHETTLGSRSEAEKSAAENIVARATSKAKDTREQLARILGGSDPNTIAGEQIENIVDNKFDNIRRFVNNPAPGQPAPIDGAMVLINDIYAQLSATETAVKAGNTPPQSEVPSKVKAESARLPEPVRSMLQTLATAGASQALGATRANLSASISSSIGDFCRQAIVGRYPFVRSSNRDVTQDDFARLFAPGGLIDEFFQKNLGPFVDTSSKPWSFKRVGEVSMGDSSGSLPQFQRAAVIRDTYFRGGGRGVGMRLEFKPLEMDGTINQFTLDVDGQVIKYSHGPQVPTTVQWPGPKGSAQVRLQITPPSSAGASGMVFEGPWALFRMFDRLQIDTTEQPERFRVTFNIEGRKATFEVIASSVQNPFRLRELELFQCPGQL